MVFPVFNHSPEIEKVWAGPMFWGPEVKDSKGVCGSGPLLKKIKVSSESSGKGPFKFKVQAGPNGSITEFMGPGTQEIYVPAECVHLRLRAKSLGLGQLIRCEIY